MSNEQYSPWSSGDGFGTPQPAPRREQPFDPPPHTVDLPLPAAPPSAGNYQNPVLGGAPAEPGGWSEPQQFVGLQPSSQTGPPVQFGQQVPYGYGAALLPEHPNSTLVLVLGIAGLITNFLAFPFISPIAWYLGAKARRDIAHNPGVYRDNGKLTAGLALGVVGTLLALAFIGFVVLLIMLAVMSS